MSKRGNGPTVIIGAGITGLSVAYHLWHLRGVRSVILERSPGVSGHLKTTRRDGLLWDDGPHVSFTKDTYVRELFERSTNGQFEEYDVSVGNYAEGLWIPHPAQNNLYYLPPPVRDHVLTSMLEAIEGPVGVGDPPRDYREWLCQSFGSVFSEMFPGRYTRKYWTVDPAELSVDWVGTRVHRPNADEVRAGAAKPGGSEAHYIRRVRYPSEGGFQSYTDLLAADAPVRLNAEVVSLDLKRKTVSVADGTTLEYETLINTLPLPAFVDLLAEKSEALLDGAGRLMCTEALLVNVAVPHSSQRPENWLYVYDADKLSTRVHFTEKLSPKNAPTGWSGIQVEVYSSVLRPRSMPDEDIERIVVQELVAMGLVDPTLIASMDALRVHSTRVPYANVVFDHNRQAALTAVWDALEPYGYVQNNDQNDVTTDWAETELKVGSLIMAGRYGRWKYYWSDDCVLDGRAIAEAF